MEERQLLSIIRRVDTDSDAKISFEELAAFIMGTSAIPEEHDRSSQGGLVNERVSQQFSAAKVRGGSPSKYEYKSYSRSNSPRTSRSPRAYQPSRFSPRHSPLSSPKNSETLTNSLNYGSFYKQETE
jgi:hypothetical protein